MGDDTNITTEKTDDAAPEKTPEQTSLAIPVTAPETTATSPAVAPEKTVSETTAPDVEQEYKKAFALRGSKLQKLVDVILDGHSSRERVRLAQCIQLTADGETWKEVQKKANVRWIEVTCLAHNKKWKELWDLARATGESVRQEIRESVAHTRAVQGWKEPVFNKGIVCGHIRRFDNRLLEFLLRADNPEKYSQAQNSVNIHNNVVSTVVEMHRE